MKTAPVDGNNTGNTGGKGGFSADKQTDDKPRFAKFAPPAGSKLPGGKARKMLAYGTAKP